MSYVMRIAPTSLEVQRHAAIAATVLGDRGTMLGWVVERAQQDAADCDVELALALQASPFDAARKLLRTLAPGDATGSEPTPGARQRLAR